MPEKRPLDFGRRSDLERRLSYRQSYVHEHYRRLPDPPLTPPRQTGPSTSRSKKARLNGGFGIAVPRGVGKGVFDSGFGNVFERAESPDMLDMSPDSSPFLPAAETGGSFSGGPLYPGLDDFSDPSFTDVTMPLDSDDVAESQRSILAMIRAEAEAAEAAEGEVLNGVLLKEDPDAQGEPYIADTNEIIEIKSEESEDEALDVVDCETGYNVDSDDDLDISAIELEKAVARLEEADRARAEAERARKEAERLRMEAELTSEKARRGLKQAEMAFRRSIELTKTTAGQDSESLNSEFSIEAPKEESLDEGSFGEELEAQFEQIEAQKRLNEGNDVNNEPLNGDNNEPLNNDSDRFEEAREEFVSPPQMSPPQMSPPQMSPPMCPPQTNHDDLVPPPTNHELMPAPMNRALEPPNLPVSSLMPRFSLGDFFLNFAVTKAQDVQVQEDRDADEKQVVRAKGAKQSRPRQPRQSRRHRQPPRRVQPIRQVQKRVESKTKDGIEYISHQTGLDSDDDMTSSSDDGTYETDTEMDRGSESASLSDSGSAEVEHGVEEERVLTRLESGELDDLESDNQDSDCSFDDESDSDTPSEDSAKKDRAAKLETRKSLSLIYYSDGSERGSEDVSGSESGSGSGSDFSDEEAPRVNSIARSSNSRHFDDPDSGSDSDSSSDSGEDHEDISYIHFPDNDDDAASSDDDIASGATSSSSSSSSSEDSPALTRQELELSFSEAINEVAPLSSTLPPRRTTVQSFRAVNQVQWWLVYPPSPPASVTPPKAVEALVDLCTRSVGKNTDRLPLQMIQESERGWDFWSKIWTSILDYHKDSFAVFVCFAAVFGKRAQFSCHTKKKTRSKHVITSHHRLELVGSVLTVKDIDYLQSVLSSQGFKNNLILSCTGRATAEFVLPALPRLHSLTVLDLRSVTMTNGRLSTWVNTLKRGEWPHLRAVIVGLADSKTMKEFLQFPHIWYVGFEPLNRSTSNIRVGDMWYRCATRDILDKKKRWNYQNATGFDALLKTAVSTSPSSRLFARLKEYQRDLGVHGHVMIETCFGVDLEAGVEEGRQLPDHYVHLVRVKK